MKHHGTYLVPTTYLRKGINLDIMPADIRKKAEYLLPLARKSLEAAIKAKVKIAFGTDTPVFPHGQNAKEISALVEQGMVSIEAIRTATVNAAEMMQLEDRGKIKPGLLADVIGVKVIHCITWSD